MIKILCGKAIKASYLILYEMNDFVRFYFEYPTSKVAGKS